MPQIPALLEVSQAGGVGGSRGAQQREMNGRRKHVPEKPIQVTLVEDLRILLRKRKGGQSHVSQTNMSRG